MSKGGSSDGEQDVKRPKKKKEMVRSKSSDDVLQPSDVKTKKSPIQFESPNSTMTVHLHSIHDEHGIYSVLFVSDSSSSTVFFHHRFLSVLDIRTTTNTPLQLPVVGNTNRGRQPSMQFSFWRNILRHSQCQATEEEEEKEPVVQPMDDGKTWAFSIPHPKLAQPFVDFLIEYTKRTESFEPLPQPPLSSRNHTEMHIQYKELDHGVGEFLSVESRPGQVICFIRWLKAPADRYEIVQRLWNIKQAQNMRIGKRQLEINFNMWKKCIVMDERVSDAEYETSVFLLKTNNAVSSLLQLAQVCARLACC